MPTLEQSLDRCAHDHAMEVNITAADPGDGIVFVSLAGEKPGMQRERRGIGIVDLEDEIFPLAYL